MCINFQQNRVNPIQYRVFEKVDDPGVGEGALKDPSKTSKTIVSIVTITMYAHFTRCFTYLPVRISLKSRDFLIFYSDFKNKKKSENTCRNNISVISSKIESNAINFSSIRLLCNALLQLKCPKWPNLVAKKFVKLQ